MGKRPNIKLSEATGDETRDALTKYRDAYDLDSQEKAIRQLLPNWAFNPLIPPAIGRVIELTERSRHYNITPSEITDTGYLYEILEQSEDNEDTKLISEIEDILQSDSHSEESG